MKSQNFKRLGTIAFSMLFAACAFSAASAQTWQKLSGPFPYINRIITANDQPGRLIVLSDEDSTNLDITTPYYTPVGMGYMVSADSGRTFSEPSLKTFSTLDIAISPTNPNLWYASIRNVFASGIAYTDNAGAVWHDTILRCDGAHNTYKIVSTPTKYYMARVNIARGIATTDNDFEICTPYQAVQAQMRDVKISTVSGAIFYAADRYNTGVYSSTDDGATFTKNESGLEGESVLSVQPSPEIAEYVVCGTTTGIFASTNGGKDWTKLPYATGAVYDIAVHPTDPNFWCAATETGVWVSGNKGTGWEMHRDGLPNERVTRVAIPNWSTANGLVMYAGVHKNGLYISKPTITSAEEYNSNVLRIVSQYPMPFVNDLNMIWNAPRAGAAMIAIRNQMGTEIYRSEMQAQAGQNLFNWKTENELPSGVYFVEIKTLDGSLASKVVKLN